MGRPFNLSSCLRWGAPVVAAMLGPKTVPCSLLVFLNIRAVFTPPHFPRFHGCRFCSFFNCCCFSLAGLFFHHPKQPLWMSLYCYLFLFYHVLSSLIRGSGFEFFPLCIGVCDLFFPKGIVKPLTLFRPCTVTPISCLFRPTPFFMSKSFLGLCPLSSKLDTKALWVICSCSPLPSSFVTGTYGSLPTTIPHD